jgi:hypothetical protein
VGSFSEWQSKPVFDGVLYVPPEGAQLGAIRVEERIRPLESLAALVSSAVERLVSVVDDRVISVDPLVTFEGEHAAMVHIAGRRKRGRKPVEFQIGFVFGDDALDRISAYCADDTQFKPFRISMRSFILEHRLRLAALRARRFAYAPPVGWNGRARNLRAQWFPEAYPLHASRICVTPAMPCERAFSELEVELLEVLAARGFELTDRGRTQRFSTDHGLNGVVSHFIGTSTHVVAATMLDDRYGYHLRLETEAARLEVDRAAFMRVVKSVRPIPPVVTGQSEALLRALTPAAR